jgi:diaminohydroxyphosphoribosylaminopyrimidine deaminase / 5-amino-6-(5-phosphoribosylamino)uracil reductase
LAATGTDIESAHLRRALALAEEGRGRVSPNPLVGAVLTSRGGEVIGEGFHARVGELHAERAALADCRERGADPAGATMYVTLEPCAHTGRQPPCTDAILQAGIARVVYASEDPTEKASGRGPGVLRDGGVEVVLATGAEAAAARLLNQPFRKHARTGRPLVTYKAATTLDGRVAAPGGDSRWISSARSRELVHRRRSQCDAIAVGIGTALADDPLLTARPGEATAATAGEPAPSEQNPVRVVFDSMARLPLDSALLASVDDGPVMVICSAEAPTRARDALTSAGAEVVIAPGPDPAARLAAALVELGSRGLQDLLLEGGPTLAGSFFDADEIDSMMLFVAPLLLGAAGAPSPLEGRGASRIADGTRPLAVEHEPIGEDLLIKARVREW